MAACGAEIEQDVGRQGGEGELLGLVDQDAGSAMCWLRFRIRGRLRVGRPVMWRSGRVRVAKVVKGSWVSRMMRIVALDWELLPPPVLFGSGDGSGLLAGCHGVQVGKLVGG